MKYKYEKDLRIYSLLNPPVIPSLLPFMQRAMKSFYIFGKSDKELFTLSLEVTSFDGEKIPTLLYVPKEADGEKTPLIIFYHGGGFVYNAAPHHFSMAKALAKALKVKVAFVDYRLAPKYPFPVAPEDAFSAYKYFLLNSDIFGIDKEKIGLCGDSAGGNLAAVTALMARDRGFALPCGLSLIYPFVDRSSETESMKKYTDTPMCNSKAAVKYNEAYTPEGNPTPIEYHSVVDAPSLKDFPPCFIETAEFDCLHDGGIKLYERLKNEGRNVSLYETKGTMHGYDIAVNSKTVKICTEKRVKFFKEVFEL